MSRVRASSACRLTVCFVVLLTLAAVSAEARVPALSNDGWHVWQVRAVNSAPHWCCLDRRTAMTGTAERSCSLDTPERHVYGDPAAASLSREVRVYVRVDNGAAVEVRAFSAACPTMAADGIEDHGVLEADASAGWLAARVASENGPVRGALAALAVHDGDVATQTLRRLAARGPTFGLRKEAVFWMGQVRAQLMRADLRARMFDDADARMREHAAFSWSQSDLDERGEALIELARRDADAEVRGQAWFWLGQTGDVQTEAAIAGALRAEDSAAVREQAIFALSQLGNERSAAALIAIIEDRALAAGDRERAVFWLAQDTSVQALEYLARVLDSPSR